MKFREGDTVRVVAEKVKEHGKVGAVLQGSDREYLVQFSGFSEWFSEVELESVKERGSYKKGDHVRIVRDEESWGINCTGKAGMVDRIEVGDFYTGVVVKLENGISWYTNSVDLEKVSE